MSDITGRLGTADAGNEAAVRTLFARVYDELKLLARKQLASQSGATLNTTGLVHEAYLKLAQPEARTLHNRVHFFALAAKAMRQIVIDRARARSAEKRGGARLELVEIDAAADLANAGLPAVELLRLDQALTQLEGEEPRLAHLVELRFFAGLDVGEIALLQTLSERTVNRDWRRAKAYLYEALHPEN